MPSHVKYGDNEVTNEAKLAMITHTKAQHINHKDILPPVLGNETEKCSLLTQYLD